MSCDWLLHQDEYPNAQELAVAVARYRGSHFHAGLIYRADTKHYCLLHLLGHETLEHCDFPTADWEFHFVVVSGAPVVLQRYVSRYCRMFAGRLVASRIPYGFSQAAFDKDTGRALWVGGSEGLTCASLVLALLRTGKIELLELSNWPNRPDDCTWQQGVVDSYSRHGAASAAHIAAMQADVGHASRCLPTEVAGAASEVMYPVPFSTASVLGDAVTAALPGNGA